MRKLNPNEINAVSGGFDQYDSLGYTASEIDFVIFGASALIVGAALLIFCCIKSCN